MAGITDLEKDQKGEEDAQGGTESDGAENDIEQSQINGHGEIMSELPSKLSTSGIKSEKMDVSAISVPAVVVQKTSTVNGDMEESSPLENGDKIVQNGHASSDEASASELSEKSNSKDPLFIDINATGTELSPSESEHGDEPGATESKEADGIVSKGDSEGETKSEEEKSKEQEIVLIQDTGFNIQVSCPGLEPFDLPVSSMELVQEIHQVLMDREDTCHRTCFSLQLDGITLDNFAELKTIEGLKDGSLIKVIEEPYTGRESRIHVRHVRDLLKSVDFADAYNGVDCNSLSFLNTVTAGDILEKKRGLQKSIDCTPPDFIMPNNKDRPLTPLHLSIKDQKAPSCLKVLTYSGWNPPPGPRRLHGDLLYLYVVTLEEKRFHLTASSRGFYVNQSNEDEFNPRPAAQKHIAHSLIELLNQLSPAFKRNFGILLKKRAQKHPFERMPTPYQVYTWLAPTLDHSVDYIRAEDAFSTRLGYEEHIPGQTRDWNEELQTTRELSRKTLPERLIRERAIFKVHSDFVAAATRGAIAVIDGNVMAINPGEETKMQMFIWNNIFFSLGFDVRDHYKDFGGDSAAYAAPGNDLQGVKAYFSVDPEELYTLGTVVVDYRGYRVTAQSIIPGILEREQEQSVVYGSVDFGKTVVTHEKYKELLQKTATQLKIRPHKVINDKDEEIELFSSVECKGIIGNDQRHYILDLLRTFPPDVNFLPVEGEELSPAMKKLGFPRQHRHKLVCLRQELIDTFVELRYVAFVKQAAFQFQQLQLRKQTIQHIQEEPVEGNETKAEKKEEKAESVKEKDTDKKVEIKTSEIKTKCPLPEKLLNGSKEGSTIEADEAKKIVEALTGTDFGSFEENSKEIVRKACCAVGSLSDTEFNLTFNPDVLQPQVKHANSESETFKREKQLVKDAAEFMVVHQIPSMITDCLDHTSSPIDGMTLTEAMHHRGINMRYLGRVTEVIAKYPQISYLHSIAISELVCRAAKHLFKLFMQGIDMLNLSASMSHFLNCLLGSYPTPYAQAAADESKAARRRSRKRNKASISSPDITEWLSETPRSMWKKICDEIKEYYRYTLDVDSVDTLVERFGIQKISLLRSFCLKCGVQILIREYNMDSKHKQPFGEDDVVNVYPNVKHVQPKATDAYHFFTSGQSKIQQGMFRDGYELISEALNLLNNVYGAMHPEIAACLRLLARLNYIMGDYAEALSFQQRAVMMSERVLGVDHPNTITEYAHLALYCFANNQVSSALQLMYRARYLALLCHGENHPEIALFDSNIGLILHAVEEYELSLRFLDKALELNIRYFGSKSLKVAMSYHLVARTHSCRGDFRAALLSEKEAYTIYKQQFGENHERTKESSDCLKHLTQQAVVFQKKMNEIEKGEKNITLPPLQIQTPSLSSVLDTLNAINGIVFVSQEDIDKLRSEIVKRQQSSQSENKSISSAEDADKEKLKENSDNTPILENGNKNNNNNNNDGVNSEKKSSKSPSPITVKTCERSNEKTSQSLESIPNENGTPSDSAEMETQESSSVQGR